MRKKIGLVLCLASLAGCGSSEPNREIGGAMTGAGTGAAIGLIGGPIGVVGGAVIGGLAGAGTGAAVSSEHINLGQPFWAQR